MSDLYCYKLLPEWTFDSLPKGFRRRHNTKEGTWAKLNIISGKLIFYKLNETGNVLDSCVFDSLTDTPFIEPQAWHKVEPLTKDLRCQLAFYCKAEHFYQKKYGLSATHSEMFEVIKRIKSGSALDFGCGSGRNALFLQRHGFSVTAFDKNVSAIQTLNNIIGSEKLKNIQAYVGDAHDFIMKEQYDLIVSTVVLMFLDKEKIPRVINNIKNSTNKGGCNVIVCAIDSEDYPLKHDRIPFSFGFEPNELLSYYDDWKIEKYNEDVGCLHRLDEMGDPIKLRFATIIARKV